jgi:hypothetical protein
MSTVHICLKDIFDVAVACNVIFYPEDTPFFSGSALAVSGAHSILIDADGTGSITLLPGRYTVRFAKITGNTDTLIILVPTGDGVYELKDLICAGNWVLPLRDLLQISKNLSDVADPAAAFAAIKQPATAVTPGVVQLAAQAEVDAGTDAAKAVTPATLQNAAKWGTKADASQLPKYLTVANAAARLALTSAQVNVGDAVRELDSMVIYQVVELDKLGTEDGFNSWVAGALYATTADMANSLKGDGQAYTWDAFALAHHASSHGAGQSDPVAINASQVTAGTFDVARIPVFPSQTIEVSTGDLTALTAAQQTAIAKGSVVTTTDGNRWVYAGSGDKTLAASYIQLADITPEWSVIANKPTLGTAAAQDTTAFATAAQGALAASALQLSGSGAGLTGITPAQVGAASADTANGYLFFGFNAYALPSVGMKLAYGRCDASGVDFRLYSYTPLFSPTNSPTFRDVRLVELNGTYWIAWTRDAWNYTTASGIGLAYSTDLIHWTQAANIPTTVSTNGACWAANWFKEPGTTDYTGLHIFWEQGASANSVTYESHPLNAALTSWSTQAVVSGPMRGNSPSLKLGSLYLLYNDNGVAYTASSYLGPYTAAPQYNVVPAGWASMKLEAIPGNIIKLSDRYRAFIDNSDPIVNGRTVDLGPAGTATNCYYCDSVDLTTWGAPIPFYPGDLLANGNIVPISHAVKSALDAKANNTSLTNAINALSATVGVTVDKLAATSFFAPSNFTSATANGGSFSSTVYDGRAWLSTSSTVGSAVTVTPIFQMLGGVSTTPPLDISFRFQCSNPSAAHTVFEARLWDSHDGSVQVSTWAMSRRGIGFRYLPSANTVTPYWSDGTTLTTGTAVSVANPGYNTIRIRLKFDGTTYTATFQPINGAVPSPVQVLSVPASSINGKVSTLCLTAMNDGTTGESTSYNLEGGILVQLPVYP